MPSYSPKHTKPFNAKHYQKALGKTSYKVLKQLNGLFSPSTLKPFYDHYKNKDDIINSPRQAIDRSHTLAIRVIFRVLSLINNRVGLNRSDRRKLIKLLTSSVSPISNRASDTELRIQLTYSFIRCFFRLHKATIKDKDVEFYLLTFSCDSWCSSEYKPIIDLYKAKEEVSRLLRRYGLCNAIGVFEIQPLMNDPLAKDPGFTLMLHCHVVVWRTKWSGLEFEKFREKVENRLWNSRLESPVHRKPLKRKKNDFLRIASYLPKLPGYAKRWNSKLELVNGEKQLSRKRILRHLEILSYIPQKSLIFAIGDHGRKLKTDIWSDAKASLKTRVKQGSASRLSHKQIRDLWARIWDEIDPNYSTPPRVYVQRGDRNGS